MCLLTAAVLCGCTAPAASDIDRFTTAFSGYPQNVPTDKNPDAPLAGNGDIGVTMCASPGMLRFYVGKNDFWRAYPEHLQGSGPALPGGLDITADIISRGRYAAEQLPGSAALKASFTDGADIFDIRAWVHATQNIVVLEMTASEKTELTLKLWSPEGYGSHNAFGHDDDVTWVTRSLGDVPEVEFPSDICMAVNVPDSTVILNPGEKSIVVLTAFTNHDTADWKQAAIGGARLFSGKIHSWEKAMALKSLAKSHQQWWDSFWNESGVDIGDSELEYYYYTSQYLFACSSRSGKFAPGLWGPFITTDFTAWNGDYHLNYNYQAPFWHCFSSNHLSLTDNYDQPVLDFMDTGRELARTLADCDGVLYPVGISPMGAASTRWVRNPDDVMYRWYRYSDPPLEGGYMFWGQKTDAAFAAANMMMRFYSTYDEEYARKVYPFVSACADFYADFVKERDGRFVIADDTFYEVMPWSDDIHDYNSVTALGLARMSMRGAAALSEFLGEDSRKRARWLDVESGLADYPIGYNDEGRLSLKDKQRNREDGEDGDVRATGLNRVSIHGLVLPSGVAGPMGTPELNNVLLDDIRHWSGRNGEDWGNSLGNGFETSYPGAVRIGYPAAEILRHMKERIAMQTYPNGWIYQGGGGIETLSGVPMTINEMFLQSYEGVIRIFPNWDRTIDASYRALRAYGAFLVSSSISGGQIGEVRIHSEKGRSCVLENPWPGHDVEVFRNGTLETVLHDAVMNIGTSAGDDLLLVSRVTE